MTPIEFLQNLAKGTKYDGIDVMEILENPDLFGGMQVHEELFGSHRWWDEWLHIIEFVSLEYGVKYIGYVKARANRDESVYDLGWNFDNNSIVFMKPIEKTITTYIKE